MNEKVIDLLTKASDKLNEAIDSERDEDSCIDMATVGWLMGLAYAYLEQAIAMLEIFDYKKDKKISEEVLATLKQVAEVISDSLFASRNDMWVVDTMKLGAKLGIAIQMIAPAILSLSNTKEPAKPSQTNMVIGTGFGA